MPPSYNGFSFALFPCLLLIPLAPPFLYLLIMPNIYPQTTLLTPQTFPGQSFQPPSCYMLMTPKCNTISPQSSFQLLETFQNIAFSSPKSKTHTHTHPLTKSSLILPLYSLMVSGTNCHYFTNKYPLSAAKHLHSSSQESQSETSGIPNPLFSHFPDATAHQHL